MSLKNQIQKSLLISRYAEETADFLQKLDYFNPEPVIVNNHRDILTVAPKAVLARLITWKEIRDSKVVGPLFNGSSSETKPLSELLEELSLDNFKLEATIPVSGTLEGFSIVRVSWFSKIWSCRNPLVPPYVPKNLSNGLFVELNHEGLFVCQKVVSPELWFENDHNRTRIIPVSEDNFRQVVIFQSNMILKQFLQITKE
ncbi:MAG TPA: hypothetical protein VF837_02405 [Patescibacteria group bacterium]